MKKLCIFIVIVIVACLALGCTVCAEATTAVAEADSSVLAKTLLVNFLTACPDRAYDTQGELDAAKYIYNHLGNIGLDVDKKLLDASVNGNSYNVFAKIDTNGTNDTIIIGAHYDAVGCGATDNATGVVALLMTAQQLYNNRDSLQCDVVFVAFAGEEVGFLGSLDYVNSMTSTDKANTKLMINIDAIGMGDNLMVSGQLTKTHYIDALIAGGYGAPSQLQYKPFSADLDFSIDYYGYGYYETLQSSDHTVFAIGGIPTALFFSGSYNTIGRTYVESTNINNCVMNTAKDTLETLASSGVNYGGRIITVANSISNAVLNNSQALLDAPNQTVSKGWFSAMAVNITYVVIAVVVVVLAIIYYKKLVRQAIISGQTGGNGAVGISRVFTKPDSQDIFDL